MSTQIEIEIPEQPVETTRFKRNQEVWMQLEGVNFRNVRIVEHYDFNGCYRVMDGHGELIVTESELFTGDEKVAQIEICERSKWASVIRMWKEGKRTAKEMGEATQTKPSYWVQKIKACQRRGFIS